MVLVVALNNLPDPFTRVRRRVVLPADEFCLDSTQFRHHPLLGRFAPDDECAIAPPLPAVMREAEEREGFRLPLPAPLPVSFAKLPELNQPRLVRMQFQTELRQPLSELAEKAFGFRPAFEAHHKVSSAGESHPDALSEPYLNLAAQDRDRSAKALSHKAGMHVSDKSEGIYSSRVPIT
jgi:hypothetical protein